MDTEYEHLSCDVWGTIVSVNPQTKVLRTAFLAEHFRLSPEEAHATYSSLKASFDDVENNRSNYCKETDDCYKLLVRRLRSINMSEPTFVEQEARYVRSVFEDIFRKAPPHVSIELIGAIRTLHARRKMTLSLGSNSNFIAGTLMRDYLYTMFGPDVFAFAVHSDEVGWAKPHYRFYDAIRENAVRCGINPRRILHVGDNKECDLEGAIEADMHARMVKNPTETFLLIQGLLQ